jgi:restriction endonuclease S subunit
VNEYLITIEPYYLLQILKELNLNNYAKRGGQPSISQSTIYELSIPLPPIEAQREIVAEIEGYQKIIDGARQVVDNWKPHIDIDPDWPMVKLGDAPIEIIDGDRGVNYPKKEDFSVEGYCLFLNTSNVRKGFFNFESSQFISEQRDIMLRKGKLKYNDIVLTTRGTVGNIAYYDKDIMYKNIRINSGMLILRVDPKRFEPSFVVKFFLSDLAEEQIRKILSGSAQPQLPIRSLIEFQIPLPPIEVQQEIVKKIEAEQKAVDGCRELVVLYEEKIRRIVEKVWE